MSSYRFCRTDDIGLLVDALNRCWAPSFPSDPPMTPAAFKRSIRNLQVWCSSCMVAFAGADPIGVLIGAKRSSATLIHRIAVHPEHQRQGHGRHLLVSLSSKLAILGPPRIMSEVVATNAAACELFRASGYVAETTLTDYVWEGPRDRGSALPGYVIPVTFDDLGANGLLGEQNPLTPWERSIETLTARKDEIEGLAVASDERIEAYVLYLKTHAYHWNVTGPLFASLHTLFETEYNELHDAADTLAERIRALGRYAPGSYATFTRLASIKEDNDEIPAAMSMIANLVMGHEAVGRTLRAAFKVAEAGGDQATMDMLIGRMEASDKAAWMLRSHLEKPE